MKSQWKKACTYWYPNKNVNHEENGAITDITYPEKFTEFTPSDTLENESSSKKENRRELSQVPVDLSLSAKFSGETIQKEICINDVENVSSLTANIAMLSNQIQKEMDKLCEVDSNINSECSWKCMYCPYIGRSSTLLHSHYQYHQLLLASQSSLAHIEWLSAYRNAQENAHINNLNNSYNASDDNFSKLKENINTEMLSSNDKKENSYNNAMISLPKRLYASKPPQSASSFLKSFVKAVMQQNNQGSHAVTSSAIYTSMLNVEHDPSEAYYMNSTKLKNEENMKISLMETYKKRKYESDETDEDVLSTSSSDLEKSKNDCASVNFTNNLSSNSASLLQHQYNDEYKNTPKEIPYDRNYNRLQYNKNYPFDPNYAATLGFKPRDNSMLTAPTANYSLNGQYFNDYQMDGTLCAPCNDKTLYLPPNTEIFENKTTQDVITPINVLPTDNCINKTQKSKTPYNYNSSNSSSTCNEPIKVKTESTSEVKMICFEDKMIQCDLINSTPTELNENEKDHNFLNSSSAAKTCPHCMITFNDEILFSIHIGVHSHNKPFDCNVCGKSYENRYTFYTHLIRGHYSV